ncbi:MAG TPA: prepilin-type N-terminal cleavage/methylation domain-containing protein [Pirellulaceae bacterium]|nr:prepilin-type N-terminal cleavage/methylation domain-containing protein [Pirellulaceae bacterium]
MCRFLKPRSTRTPRARAGMTLLELLLASSIMAIMAGVLGGLALSVQMQSEHSEGQGEAVQHARVVIDRMQRLMNEANASESFPGFLVLTETVGGNTFPDTVVIWTAAAPLYPNALPLWKEVTVICPDSQTPNLLWEITTPADSSPVPALTDTALWRTKLAALKTSSTAVKTELTTLLRTADAGNSQRRGAIRFDIRKRPSDEQWTAYKPPFNQIGWADLDWVQGIYGSRTGLRQVWCRMELQLMPGANAAVEDPTGQSALTFFGSAAVYHEMHK